MNITSAVVTTQTNANKQQQHTETDRYFSLVINLDGMKSHNSSVEMGFISM